MQSSSDNIRIENNNQNNEEEEKACILELMTQKVRNHGNISECNKEGILVNARNFLRVL